MSVTIISPEEWHWAKFGGSEFEIRRMDSKTKRDIREKSRVKKNGVMSEDEGLLMDNCLNFICRNWRNVKDDKGVDVPFSEEMLSMIPERVKIFIVSQADEIEIDTIKTQEEDIKN